MIIDQLQDVMGQEIAVSHNVSTISEIRICTSKLYSSVAGTLTPTCSRTALFDVFGSAPVRPIIILSSSHVLMHTLLGITMYDRGPRLQRRFPNSSKNIHRAHPNKHGDLELRPKKNGGPLTECHVW